MRTVLLIVAVLVTHVLLARSQPKSDSLMIAEIEAKSRSFGGSNYDSMEFYARKGLALSNQLNDDPGRVKMLNLIGTKYFFTSAYDSAIYYYDLAHELSKTQGDSAAQSSLLNNIGMALTYQSKYDTSILVLLEAMKIRERLQDPKISSTLNNLGNAYMKMEDYERSLKYYLEAAALKREHGQRRSLSNTLNNIGIILKGMGKYDEAIEYYQQSLDIAVEFNDKNKQANAHNNIASLYYDGLSNYSMAEKHFLKAIELKTEMKDKAGLYNSYGNYAELLSDMGRFKEALNVINQAEGLEEEVGRNVYTSEVKMMKADLLYNTGAYRQAFDQLKNTYYTKIEEINEDRNERIAEWETRFDTEKKMFEIEQLALANNLKEVQLKATRRNQAIILIVTVSLILLLSAYIFFYRKEQRLERDSQDLQIEALQKRLFDFHTTFESNTDLPGFDELNEQLHNELTEREYEVLKLSLQQKTNSEIANELFLSTSTVKFHLRNVYVKLGVSNRKEALDYVAKKA